MWDIHRVGPQNYLYAPEQKILVDCGPGKDQARKLKQRVGEVNLVFLTHTHVDHYGGAPYFLAAFPHLTFLTPHRELPFLYHPLLEPALLFGGFPPQALATPFLLGPDNLPLGELDPKQFPEIEFVSLPGHTPGLFGIAMGEALFASDALFGLEIVAKYPLLYHFDPVEALRTLKTIRERFTTFWPAHGSQGGKELVDHNIVAVERVFTVLFEIFRRGTASLEAILKTTLESLAPAKTLDHYFLNRSALLGYLSALERQGEITLYLTGMEVVVEKR